MDKGSCHFPQNAFTIRTEHMKLVGIFRNKMVCFFVSADIYFGEIYYHSHSQTGIKPVNINMDVQYGAHTTGLSKLFIWDLAQKI